MGPALIVLVALAVEATTPAPTPADKQKATALLREGNALYKTGDYTGALEKFQDAYAAVPSPKLLFNIGQAERDLGRNVEAIEAFDKFLTSAPDASPKALAEARGQVAELQKKVGRLQILCETTGATITLDGKDVGVAPLPSVLWTTPGRHMIAVTHPSGAPGITHAEVVAGGLQTVKVKLSPLTPVAPPPVATNPAPAATEPPAVIEPKQAPLHGAPADGPEPSAGEGWALGRTWAWVATGSAVLFAGAAAVIGYGAKSRFDELRTSCGSGSADRRGCDDGQISSLERRVLATNVLWGLAGAAAVTAGVLFVVEGHRVEVAPVAGITNGFVARVEY